MSIDENARPGDDFTPRDTSTWNPEVCGDGDLSIDAEVQWRHRGQPIEREELVRLFASVLRREGDTYYLVTPAEKVAIDVADVPFRVDAMTLEGEAEFQTVTFVTNVGETFTVDDHHPLTVEHRQPKLGPRPYVQVRDGLAALIGRGLYYRLADQAVEHRGHLGLWSSGTFFPLDH